MTRLLKKVAVLGQELREPSVTYKACIESEWLIVRLHVWTLS